MRRTSKLNIILLKLKPIQLWVLILCAIGCNDNSERLKVKRYEIEFDGFKSEFYNKYDLWLIIEDERNVKNLTQLIDSTTVKTKCNDIRPVMWIIKVHAVYENEDNRRILTLSSSTIMNEALKIGRNCYESRELVETLKILTNIEGIKMFQGKMRQKEYDKIKYKG